MILLRGQAVGAWWKDLVDGSLMRFWFEVHLEELRDLVLD
jgi:hypothetical protein